MTKPNDALFLRKITRNWHSFALFDSPIMDNLIARVSWHVNLMYSRLKKSCYYVSHQQLYINFIFLSGLIHIALKHWQATELIFVRIPRPHQTLHWLKKNTWWDFEISTTCGSWFHHVPAYHSNDSGKKRPFLPSSWQDFKMANQHYWGLLNIVPSLKHPTCFCCSSYFCSLEIPQKSLGPYKLITWPTHPPAMSQKLP